MGGDPPKIGFSGHDDQSLCLYINIYIYIYIYISMVFAEYGLWACKQIYHKKN